MVYKQYRPVVQQTFINNDFQLNRQDKCLILEYAIVL